MSTSLLHTALSLLTVWTLVGGQVTQIRSSSIGSGDESGVVSSVTPVLATIRPSTGNATCLSRTANYITHTLPQQCLRTDRIPANGTQGTGAGRSTRSDNPIVTDVLSTVVGHSTDPASATAVITVSPSAETQRPDETQTSAPLASTESVAGSSGSQHASHGPVVSADVDAETDSPLDNANFLSFEEWKKQNLAKVGQSPEHVGQGRNPPADSPRQRPGIDNALDALGEEGEIELDFSGFGGGKATLPSQPEIASSTTEDPASASPQTLRSKDAGKTCKERTNYASFDCAATILKQNPECKSVSSVLVENKDSYMLNACSADNKFFIVELCDDILIDTIVLANYEFFSSIFRHFRVSVSDRYPVKTDKWKILGTYEARNARDVQAFLIEHPQIWARYLRIEFLSHYGSEYYCPVSLLRVHGTTMLEEFRHQEEAAQGEHLDEQPAVGSGVSAISLPTQDRPESAGKPWEVDEHAPSDVPHLTSSSFVPSSNQAAPITELSEQSGQATGPTNVQEISTLPEKDSYGSTEMAQSIDLSQDPNISASNMKPQIGHNTAAAPSGTREEQCGLSNSPEVSNSQKAIASNSSSEATSTGSDSSSTPTHIEVNISTSSSTVNATRASSDASSLVASSAQFDGAPKESNGNVVPSISEPANSTRPATITSSSALPQPSTQESFFKSIHKRLQQLESNSTLSLQYIEEQSRILRDAFAKVEKRQISATTSFLTNLNDTVMTELHGFRQAYDQLWQSTVIELEGQREQYQREMLALSSRLTLVADELVWQKRMGIAQSTLLLLCLGLVLFARSGNGYLEMPLMQQMMNKSQAALTRAGWESPPASPSPESRSPVSLIRRKLWRSATEPGSGNITDASDSRPQSKDGLNVSLEPPTPPSEEADGYYEVDDGAEGPSEHDEAGRAASQVGLASLCDLGADSVGYQRGFRSRTSSPLGFT